jgi:hypothetical protein
VAEDDFVITVCDNAPADRGPYDRRVERTEHADGAAAVAVLR